MQGKLPESEGLAIRAITDSDDAVVDALISLGYSVVEAQQPYNPSPKTRQMMLKPNYASPCSILTIFNFLLV